MRVKYTKYKKSSISWVGEIPEHWQVKRLKHIFNIQKRIAGELGHNVLSITQNGIKIKDIDSGKGQLAMDYSKYQRIYAGEFGMNHMDLLTGYVDISKYDGVISPDYRVFSQIDNQSDKNYMLRLLQMCYKQKIFFAEGQGAAQLGRWRMPSDNFKNFLFPVPPKQEQTAIARFLDYKLAKINRFIQKKKQLIKLLNEQKAAIINQAVTKGLVPNTKMKDSGIVWLGEIPEHWEVKPIKYFVTCNDESLTYKTDKDYQLRYIDIGNVDSNGNVSEIVSYKFKDAPSRARRIVKSGDIIVSTVRTYLRAIMHIKGDTDNLIVSTGFAVLRPRKNVFSEFLNYAIRANYFIGKVVSESNGVSYPAINSKELITLKIAIPLIDEQKKIVQFIDSETEIINTTISTIEKEIALVEEYKTALIAEAVTGKIDVRGYEIPEITEEDFDYAQSDEMEIEEEIGMAAEEGLSYDSND